MMVLRGVWRFRDLSSNSRSSFLLPWQQPAFRRLKVFTATRLPWIYGNSQPVRLTSSPFLMLVTGLIAFCGQPCGWVNDRFYSNIMSTQYLDIMKTKGLHVRISERRLNKLKVYATSKEKTMTQLIEDWIDRLPFPEELEASVPPASRSLSPP
jgi:hypothetical protein